MASRSQRPVAAGGAHHDVHALISDLIVQRLTLILMARSARSHQDKVGRIVGVLPYLDRLVLVGERIVDVGEEVAVWRSVSIYLIDRATTRADPRYGQLVDRDLGRVSPCTTAWVGGALCVCVTRQLTEEAVPAV